MKNITLSRSGQSEPCDVEVSTMHADGLAVGQGVMLRIKGDCCPGMKPTPYKEYVVTGIKKSDRFDGKCSDVTFTAAAKVKESAAVVSDVVPAEVLPGMAQRLTSLYRRAESAKGEFVRAAVAFGVKFMEVEINFVAAETKLISTSKRGRIGAGRPDSGIEDWLAENCPEINYNTARGYKALAAKMVALMGGETPEVMAALAAPGERLISYEGAGAETDSEPGEVLTVSEDTIRLREEIFAEAPSRRKLQQMWLNLFGNEDGAQPEDCAPGKPKRTAAGALPDPKPADMAAAVWAHVMSILDKADVMDAVAYLPQKAAEACYGRVCDLAKALKKHLAGF